MLRSFALGLASFSCAGIAVVVAASTACFVAPPGTLPQPALMAPSILHDAVVPPTNAILTSLPPEFVVPVQLAGADESFYWDVFVDYDPCQGGTCPNPTPPTWGPTPVTPTPDTVDGGVTSVTFGLTGDLDPTACHRIDFLVAEGFDDGYPHTWNSAGGDIVTWFYNAGGGTDGCPEYDAGAFFDGAFPPDDAAADTHPFAPEGGAGDL